MRRLVAIVGPTGTGKSRLALYLAGLCHGEVVSADSRQVFRYMDIGTAKPSPEDRARVPHHLIDIIDPDEEFSLARYQELAYAAIEEIFQRGHVPFLTGGSGLYVRAVLEDWRLPRVSPDPVFRYNIEERARKAGVAEVYRELARIDPEAATKIGPHNLRRISRALEVFYRTGQLISALAERGAPDFEVLTIGLTAPRQELYRSVDRRVDEMIARGLVDEVKRLREMGYDFRLPSMSSIGYKQIAQFLSGELSLEEAIKKMKTETHRLIRHQYAWFRLDDERIHWFDIIQHKDEEIASLVASFLAP